jgi:ABC-type glycerol-3-phosphate transport system substrate-binding protein
LLPPLKETLENPGDIFKHFPVLQGFVDDMACGISINIDNPNFAEAEQKLKDRMGEALFGKLTPSEALDKAKEQAEEVLSQV